MSSNEFPALAPGFILRKLESPCVYDIHKVSKCGFFEDEPVGNVNDLPYYFYFLLSSQIRGLYPILNHMKDNYVSSLTGLLALDSHIDRSAMFR